MNKKKPSLLRSLGTALAVVLGIIAFAYGIQVTDVNFETTRSEDRLTQLRRVIRALVKPDIMEYELDESTVDIPFYLPCPTGQTIDIEDAPSSDPYLTASVYCASPDETVIINGYNFPPGLAGPLDFFTKSGVKKPLGDFRADDEGNFEVEVTLPRRQPVEEAQNIRATIRIRIGSAKFTDTAKVTWDMIIETVFMALLATAIGTVLAIPISFLAARNLMAENKSPLTSLALSIIGWPLGIFLGLKIVSWARSILESLFGSNLMIVGGLVLGLVLLYFTSRWAFSSSRSDQTSKIVRIFAMVIAGLLSIATLIFLEKLSIFVGKALIEPLGPFLSLIHI